MNILGSFLSIILQVVSSCFDILNKDYLHCGISLLYLFLGCVLLTAFIRIILGVFGFTSNKIGISLVPSSPFFSHSISQISNSEREKQITNSDIYW